ncbi:prepilin-type N-terminal cleavage/methylation domain-containing protein [Paludibacterium yongneupense]|uniref:prepilin-type N-terminal cleavage/methylation domain-containing protein n=1 Tax=Paludibacterium yongneupense TaxID=400061 RepID=UPI0004273543|nr:prepilin-type N-terminal cleavage/methylation domain-containing protein [Paludibacterium yongneupense]
MRRVRDRRQAGMTLIEILVAMSLMAILSVLGYRAFSALLMTRERLVEVSRQWVGLARAFRRVEGDIGRLAPQVAPVAGAAPVLRLTPDGGGRLDLLVFSVRYPDGVEWIRYRGGADGVRWSAAAPADIDKQAGWRLLDPGASVRWRLLLSDGRWVESWPPLLASAAVPRVLEMTARLPGEAPIRRLWNLP